MVNSLVERATSDLLIGPDWAMNIEICDVCNHDPAQAKDVVKGIKKRLGSRNPKVQLLALTLLETIVKNCGDIVHMHVAEKDLPHEMVKIVKKKPDVHVKEKILILIDTWQEAFRESAVRHPQYIAAYQDLLRHGAVFPQRPEGSAPLFTPPQTHPLASYPQNIRNPESRVDAVESSAGAEYPILSLSELQNARGIMDVLAEMLSALDPSNKEGLKQEVIVDLVEQCRTYKQRVMHLVNSTSDESLLSQALALNDDLQRIIAKHESIASGTVSISRDKAKPEPSLALVPVDAPLVDTGDNKPSSSNKGSASSTSLDSQLVPIPAPPKTVTTPGKVEPLVDLLSGEDFSLAIVPVGETQPHSPAASQQNALALADLYSQNNQNQFSGPNGLAAQPQQQSSFNPLQGSSVHSNGNLSGPTQPQNEQSFYSQPVSAAPWNIQIPQQQQTATSPVYGTQENYASFPPPPWEVQLDESLPSVSQPQQQQQQQQQPASGGAYNVAGSPPVPSGISYNGMNQMTINGMHPYPIVQIPQIPNHIMYPQPGQMGGYVYGQQVMTGGGGGYGYGYGYGYEQPQFLLQQGISGLSLSENNSKPTTNPSYIPPGRGVSKPEDKLFGDLVDISKFKQQAKTDSR